MPLENITSRMKDLFNGKITRQMKEVARRETTSLATISTVKTGGAPVAPIPTPVPQRSGVVPGGPPSLAKAMGIDKTPPMGTRSVERSRIWRIMVPYWNRTAWWVLFAVTVGMVLWELDDVWGGRIYCVVRWIRDEILKQFPIVPFALGVLVRHYLFRDGGRSRTE